MPLETAVLFRGVLRVFDLVIFSVDSAKGGLITFKGIQTVYIPFLSLKWGKSGFGKMINENELAREYAIEVKDALNTAIKAIPFFYFRIIVFFVEAAVYYLLIKIGFNGFKKKLVYINSYLSIYKFRKEKYETI